MITSVAIDAPAKVNLRLVVLGQETSGYHSLETIFCGISLADGVEVSLGEPGVLLEVEGNIDTGPLDTNLALRAARAFYERAGKEPAVRIRLTKRIPSAAGLGGGSSDAAATLRALDALHDKLLGPAALLDCATRLGSDVPFFLGDSPLALAWGRGERLLSLPPPDERAVLIAHDGVGLPTPSVFARLAEIRSAKPPALEAVVVDAATLSRWDRLEPLARNDLEAAAAERLPRLYQVKQILHDAGASITLLAGSGGAIFGVFPPGSNLAAAARILTSIGLSTWHTSTLRQWPSPTAGPPR